MKFGKYLEECAHPKYQHYYVAYRTLKKALKLLSKQDSVAVTLSQITAGTAGYYSRPNSPEADFQELLEKEIVKVNLFVRSKMAEINTTMSDVARKLDDAAPEDMNDLETEIDSVGDDIVFLDSYVRDNFTGFRKITKKHDKQVGIQASAWFLARLQKEPFCNIKFDELLIGLSALYTKHRTVKEAQPKGDKDVWVPPDSFERKTTKYWVRPEQVIWVKVQVIKHLPALIFGLSAKDQEALLDPIRRGDRTLEETQLITSVYFDNDQAELYHGRMAREEGATLHRFRWYGTNDGSPNKEVFIERKTHHEGWVGESSTKERFPIKQKHVKDFMTGKWTVDKTVEKKLARKEMKPEAASKMLQLATEVQTELLDKHLHPMVRTTYHRSAYQLATANDVRISLDTNLSMVNEDVPGDDKGFWCRRLEETVAKNEVIRFPFAILEVKLQGDTPPEWVSKIIGNPGVTEVYKFSKFQHGIAYLHGPRVNILPHWFDEFRKGGALEARSESMSSRRPVSSKQDDVRIDVSNEPGERLTRESEVFIKELPIKDEPSRSFSMGKEPTRSSAPPMRVAMEPPGDQLREPLLGSGAVSTRRKKYRCFPFFSSGTPRVTPDAQKKAAANVKKSMVKIEPKVFFANERTLLSWLNTAVLLATISCYMMLQKKNDMSRVCGLILSPVAIFFILYSFTVYYRRSEAIRRREAIRYDDRYGPMILVFFLLITLTAIMILNIFFEAGLYVK